MFKKRGRSVQVCCVRSCSRLRQVQALLKADGETVPDGILCSLGEFLPQNTMQNYDII